MSKAKARKGRPAGSKTAEREVVTKTVTVPACPACGSTKEPVNKRLRTEGQASGRIEGKAYGAYKHYTCNCAECGKAFLLREYTLVGESDGQ